MPEHWDHCINGPSNTEDHSNIHIGEPWHGIPTGGRAPDPELLEPGDLLIVRESGEGVRGIWTFAEARHVEDQTILPEDWRWHGDTKRDYDWIIYCRGQPEQEFDQIMREEWHESPDIAPQSLTGTAKNKPSIIEAYIEALLEHDLSGSTKDLLRTVNPEKPTAARGGTSTTAETNHPRGGESWTRDDFLVTLDLYLDDPEIEKRQNDDRVKKLADLMGRSVGSISSRLGNFRALDPNTDSGMENVGEPAQEIWDEYFGNEEELAREAEFAWERLKAGIIVDEKPGTESTGTGGEVSTGETTSTTTQRIGQGDFRKQVRDRYDDTCVLCDVDEPGLLQAGHILDWSEFEDARGDPANGLLLCYTHHRAFDLNMFTLSRDYEIAVRPGLKTESVFINQTILNREGESVTFPNAPPSTEYLEIHNERIGWLSAEE
ncbi:HNH endonuclease [Halorubrum sp. SD626R]|uniref:HNH endonuclease n=1 Tax=Halorubrum sp. SD626R TaxID=1419722 RepID=UPI00130537F4|nr:HNH endonuclease signature motif containing protein [Halorubrum sp. SD626R]